MKKATLNNPDFGVKIFPDELRYSPLTDFKPGLMTIEQDGEPVQVPLNIIELQYEIHANTYEKLVEQIDPETEEVSLEPIRVSFGAPVLFDSGKWEIPYSLFLLLEMQRSEPTEERLAIINEQVGKIPFQNSLEGFTLEVITLM